MGGIMTKDELDVVSVGERRLFFIWAAGVVVGAGLVVATIPSIMDYQNDERTVVENQSSGEQNKFRLM